MDFPCLIHNGPWIIFLITLINHNSLASNYCLLMSLITTGWSCLLLCIIVGNMSSRIIRVIKTSWEAHLILIGNHSNGCQS